MSIEDVKSRFKKDLKDEIYDSRYIVQKYLCNGSSPILNDEEIFEIKFSIANKFKIHPNEVIITGSGKLGFSIAPQKLFNDFNENSDIDVAIISNNVFDEFWSDLLDFNINIKNRNYIEEKNYRDFQDYFFRGWIRPDLFPFKYKRKTDWFNFFNDLTQKIYNYGEHKISAGIYKNFTTFELYNIKNISSIRNKIKAGVSNE